MDRHPPVRTNSVRCRPPGLELAALAALLHEGVQELLLSGTSNQARAELAEGGTLEPGVVQFQAESILPVAPGADRVGSPTIRQSLDELPNRYHSQASARCSQYFFHLP